MADARFALDGAPYTMTPTIPIPETAALDVLRALQVILVRDVTTDACNARIANVLQTVLGRPYFSRRYVQKGVTLLAEAGIIIRRWIETPTQWGLQKVRHITLAQRFAGNSESKRKAKKAKDLGAKNFSPPRARSGADPAHHGASLSNERSQNEATGAGAADAGDGTPSSSPACGEPDAGGDEPKPTPKELADFLRAAVAAVAEGKAVEPPAPREPSPRGPRRERPREVDREERPEEPPGDPVSRAEWEGRRKALADATDDQLADLAALGDRQARAEINRRHRAEVEAAKLAAATVTAAGSDPTAEAEMDGEAAVAAVAARPVPPSTGEALPRGRDSPEIVAPPPPAKPRRGLLGRLFGRD